MDELTVAVSVVVDTDILIDASRDVNDAVECLDQIEQRAVLAVSAVTEMELIVGCRNKSELRTLNSFLNRFRVVRLTEQMSDTAAGLLRRYRLSHGLLIADAFIAAASITLDTYLVSKNQSDYRFIKGLNLLPYPNPFAVVGE